MRIQITNGMFIALIINMIYPKAIGLTQGSMAREVGRDIWLSTIISSVFAAFFILLIVTIIQRLPEGDLLKQSEILVGSWFTKVLGLLFFFYFLNAMVPIMATFVYHLKDYFLPHLPTPVFIIIAILVGSYGIYFGLEVVARMALVGVFSILALNILLPLGALEKFDIRELLPVFESGIGPTTWAGRHNLADWSMVFMMTAIILPNVKNVKNWKRSSFIGVLFGLGFIVIAPIVEVGVLSADVTAQYVVSCMQLARSAQIGLYLHRFEMVMVIFFSLSLLTQIMINLYCASVSLQYILDLKDYRPLIFPVGIVLGICSNWLISNQGRALYYLENEWIMISFVISICIPLFLWILGFVKKK